MRSAPQAAADGSLLAELDALEPFGAGNPEPRFLLSGLSVRSFRLIAGDSGLALRLFDASGTSLRGVCFRAFDTALGEALCETGGPALTVAAALRRDDYSGGAELRILDAARPA